MKFTEQQYQIGVMLGEKYEDYVKRWYEKEYSPLQISNMIYDKCKIRITKRSIQRHVQDWGISRTTKQSFAIYMKNKI